MQIEVIELGVLKTNCLIFWDEVTKDAIVIDPGAFKAPLRLFVEEHELVVSHILITHGHFDHVSGVNGLKRMLEEKGQSPLVGMHVVEKDIMEKNAKERFSKHFFNVDIDLSSMEFIETPVVKFKLIEVPGHTDHSICFYNEADRILVAGDTLFYHTIGTSSYYDGPEDDLEKYIRERLFVLPPETIVYPGHARGTTIGEEIERNPYLSDADTVDPWL